MDKSVRSFSLDKYSEDQCNQPLKEAVSLLSTKAVCSSLGDSYLKFGHLNFKKQATSRHMT